MDIKIGWTKNFTIYLRMLKIMWKDIKNAPKVIGCPLWVRGSTTNDLSKCDYFCWVYWEGDQWRSNDNSDPFYITHYLEV